MKHELKIKKYDEYHSFIDLVLFCRNDANIRKLWDGGETDQIWAKQLTNLYGDEWKDVRYNKTADQLVWK